MKYINRIYLVFFFLVVGCGSSVKKVEESRKPVFIESDNKNHEIQLSDLEDDYEPKKSFYKKDVKLFSFKEIIEYALSNSLSLKSAEEQVKGLLYAEEQADKTFQLNPKVKGFVGRHDKPLAMKDGMRYEVMLTQPFEIGGQQSGRRKKGKYKRKLGEDKLFALRMQIMSKVKYLYYKGIVLNQEWKAINEVKVYFDKIIDVTHQKQNERQISDPKALLVQILYNSFMNNYDQVKEELDNNLHELKAVIYYKEDRPIGLTGDLFYKPIPFNVDQLNRLAHDSRLKLLRLKNEIHIKDGEIQLEKSKIFPELSVFLRYRRDIDDNIYDAGVSFPIPLLNTNSLNVEARKKEKNSIKSETKAVIQDIDQEIRIALRKMKLAITKIKRFRKYILRDAKRDRSLIREYYKLAGTDFLVLLQQEKVYQETVLFYWSAVKEYYKALFMLEKAVGRIFLYSDGHGWTSLNYKSKRRKNKK